MAVRPYTIETRLDLKDRDQEYFEKYITEYSSAERRLFYILRDPDWRKKYGSRAKLVSHFMAEHGLLKRTVNSMYYDIQGRITALTELKKTELRQLDARISRKKEQIDKVTVKINQAKPAVTEGKADQKQLKKYRNNKKKLYYRKNDLNRLRQRREKLSYEIEKGILKIGFGGKKNFIKQYNLEENGLRSHEGWYNRFVRERDKNIFYLGSSDESCGNQMFQLKAGADGSSFLAVIRKEKKYAASEKRGDPENYIVLNGIIFRHMQDKLMEIVKSYDGRARSGECPLSFRIRRKGKKWYLQCCFEIRYEGYGTFSKYGVIGLDYNDGFIEASETDEAGNLAGQSHYSLKFHGTGNKAENEIRQAVSRIVSEAKRKGKDIVIEDLDFVRKKAGAVKSQGKKGKKYNRMLHLFDYKRYTETLKNSCHRNRVYLNIVSPYNTSVIGKKKYSYKKKLNVHQAASYVIARRGQGFRDQIK